MITIESMVFRLERGDNKQQAAIFAYASTASAAAHRNAGYHCRLPADRVRPQRCRRVHVLAVRRGGPGAAGVLGGVRHLCTGRRLGAAAPAEGAAWRDTERADAPVPALPVGGHASKWITIAGHGCPLRGCALPGPVFVPEQFFPSSDRPELLVDLKLQDNASILATRDDVAAEFDQDARSRPGHRALLHLCRAGCDPLLSADRRRAAQRLLRPVGRGDEGAEGARPGTRAS